MAPRSDFPPVRALLFDMDGLLIDSEDLYTVCTNSILSEFGRPLLPWRIKAQMQGRPGAAAGKIFHDWAQLPITRDEFFLKQTALQQREFPKCQPLPGVEKLLKDIKSTEGRGKNGGEVHMAVSTSSHAKAYKVKTDHLKYMFDLFPESKIVKGDDERIPKGRGKPLPDIYLLTLQLINEEIRRRGTGEPEITPEECLVFEDSVPGCEAGRRAGMRVVWCPHQGLLQEYKGREKEVLAGNTGEHKEEELEVAGPAGLPGSPGHPGEIDDGWGEQLRTLEDFNYEKYGIKI